MCSSDLSGRFQLLLDKRIVMSPLAIGSDSAGTMSTAAVFKQFSFHKECNIPLEFDSTTGAITEIRSNNFGIMVLSQGGDRINMFSKVRVRFSDGS